MHTTYGILIKNGINYSHDTADSISFDNSGGGLLSNNVQDVIEEINDNKVSKSGDTISGDLAIDEPSSTTDRGQSTIIIGNNTAQGTVGNSQGCIRIFGINTGYTQIWDDRNSTNNINVVLPGQTGTLAINPTKTQFTPTYGSSVTFADRNFFVTDGSTFLEIHFCIYCENAISAYVDLVTLPTVAQNKTVQYGVGLESLNQKPHLVYNHGNYLYLDEVGLTAAANHVFAGVFRMSLL